MLNAYLTQTKQLLQNPNSPNQLYSDADLTLYINRARSQVAGDSEAIRVYPATLPLVTGQQVYPFTSIVLPNAGTLGVGGVYNIRVVWIQTGTGQIWVRPRPWAWFGIYELNTAAPASGQTKVWSQVGQGASGSFAVSPLPPAFLPTFPLILNMDVSALPIDLVDDNTPEAIPFPWTTCVPFFAAYYALLSAQSAARQADADRMMARYEEFKERARKMSNPAVNPLVYEGSRDPFEQNRLGLGQAGG